MFNLESFGKNVQTMREQLGWSRAEFQRRLEEAELPLHLTTLRRIELGEQEPKLNEALTFSSVLGVSVEALAMDASATPSLEKVQLTAALLKDEVDKALLSITEWAKLRDELSSQIQEARDKGVPDKVLLETSTMLMRRSRIIDNIKFWAIIRGFDLSPGGNE